MSATITQTLGPATTAELLAAGSDLDIVAITYCSNQPLGWLMLFAQDVAPVLNDDSWIWVQPAPPANEGRAQPFAHSLDSAGLWVAWSLNPFKYIPVTVGGIAGFTACICVSTTPTPP